MIKKRTKRNINTILSSFIMTAIAVQLTSCNLNKSNNRSDTQNSVTDKDTTDSHIIVTDSQKTQNDKKSAYIVDYTEKELTYEWDSNCTLVSTSQNKFKVEGSGASVSGSTLNITEAGTYLISGSIDDGNIVVNSTDKKAVRLIFNGLSINCSTTAPLNVIAADKVIVTLVNGTVNNIGDTERTSLQEEDETTAAIYSKSDLTFNGAGTLNISALFGDAVVSKDKLKFVSGDFKIQAADDGIKGKDLVSVRDGKFSIEADGDGIKTTNDTDTEKGNLIIEGGSFNIDAAMDGVQAENSLNIKDGVFDIISGGGSSNGRYHAEQMMGGGKDRFNRTDVINSNNTDTQSDEKTSSGGKGLKAESSILIDGGTIKINSADDSIHSNNSVCVNSGKINILSGDDGIHGTEQVEINGGEIHIEKSYEGIEGSVIKVNDGDINITSSDDGVNASNSSDSSIEPLVSVNGGYIYVNASGDGLDSNGNIEINDGVVIVSGPVDNGNGPLDCGDRNNSIVVNGGILVAAGSSGMFELPSSDSKQNCIAIASLSADAGTLCTLADEKNNVLVAFKVSKMSESMVISTPDIKKDTRYNIYTEGKYSGTLNDDGFAEGGTLSSGTEAGNCTTSSTVTTIGEFRGPMGGGNRGGMPFEKGEKPQRPQGGNRGDFVPDENFVPGQKMPEGTGSVTNGENTSKLSQQ